MRIAAVLLAMAVIAATVLIAHTVSDNPHDFSDSDCYKCHVDPSERPKAMRTSVSRMCEDCHRKVTRKGSHPVEQVPQLVTVPADLPLTNGKITCNTCHNIHGKRFSSFGQKTYFLRRAAIGREFCMSCHETRRSLDKHIDVIAIAHEGNRYSVVDDSKPLDPMSLECIGCHDGSMAKAVSFGLGQGVWNHNSGIHPIGVEYRESRMRKGGLIPLSMLDKKIRLFGGRIGCGTCHDLYSKLPAKLCKSNAGSALCLSCHNK